MLARRSAKVAPAVVRRSILVRPARTEEDGAQAVQEKLFFIVHYMSVEKIFPIMLSKTEGQGLDIQGQGQVQELADSVIYRHLIR